MRESRLRQFGLAHRRAINAPIKKIELIQVKSMKMVNEDKKRKRKKSRSNKKVLCKLRK